MQQISNSRADYISRDIYLQKLIHRKGNNQIKVITGPRRCGKSWLLKKIYRDYLIKDEVSAKNIIMISFDIDDDTMEEDLTDSRALKSYLYKRITDYKQIYYVFLDEVQEVMGFERIVNGLNAHDNVDVLCSAIRSLTNPSRISNTLKSIQHTKVDDETFSSYLTYLEDAFLFEGAKRYNIKGHKYYESIKKYYSVDIGLRNAKLNFRQQEITHIMENVIYNELQVRGYIVYVGVIELRKMMDDKSRYVQLEVDFIATNGMEKYYIQSAYAMPDDKKREHETASLKKIDDSFRKIVIVGDDIASYIDESGITYMGLFQFLKGDKI